MALHHTALHCTALHTAGGPYRHIGALGQESEPSSPCTVQLQHGRAFVEVQQGAQQSQVANLPFKDI